MVSDAERLLSNYNAYRFMTGNVDTARTQGRYLRALKPTPERIATLHEMSTWCRTRGIDPQLWLFLLFRVRMWRFAPPLQREHLMSEKMIDRYRNMKGLDGYQRHLRHEHARAHGRGEYDPNRDLNLTAESRKKYYLETQQPGRCMREMTEMLGFHPRSQICRVCPSQSPCKEQLQSLVHFDIIALREGRLTTEQAMMEVRHACGF